MRRTKAERRHNDWRKIHKKANIIRHVWEDEGWYKDFWGKQMHRLSKNKIHCSCPMCSAKTNRNGYKISDLKKLESLQYSLDENEMNMKVLPRHIEW